MIELGRLPNLRKFIVPDEGMVLIDMDLARADLFAVAWDSGCQLLKDRLRREDVHTTHANEFLKRCTYEDRQATKKAAHAADYLVGIRTAANQLNWPEARVREFLTYWFTTYPEISKWHRRVEGELRSSRTVANAFGYRRVFFDRLEDCLPEAVAWIGQSTVAIVINKALDAICTHLPEVQPLLQVHDSLTLQVPSAQLERLIPLIRQHSLITVPYPDPLIIPVGFKVSDVSWGDVK